MHHLWEEITACKEEMREVETTVDTFRNYGARRSNVD